MTSDAQVLTSTFKKGLLDLDICEDVTNWLNWPLKGFLLTVNLEMKKEVERECNTLCVSHQRGHNVCFLQNQLAEVQSLPPQLSVHNLVVQR